MLHSSLLAVATRKRLMIFHFQGNEFVELKDIGLPDIHCMQWLGDSVCAGVKRECAASGPPACLPPVCSSLLPCSGYLPGHVQGASHATAKGLAWGHASPSAQLPHRLPAAAMPATSPAPRAPCL